MVYIINGEQLTNRKLVTIKGSAVTTETTIPLGLNINLPGVKAAGADVRLAKLDGTPIAREIECMNVPNTDDVMIWYPFDTIANTDSQFYVYWGNSNLTEPAADSTYGSQNVWDSGYIGVWHMNQDPSGTAPQLKNSKSNSWNGTSYGSMTSGDLVNGNYDKAIDFDGSNDYFDTGDITHGDIVTLEGYIYVDSTAVPRPILSKMAAIGWDAMWLSITSAHKLSAGYSRPPATSNSFMGYTASNSAISTDTNHHIGYTKSGLNDTQKLYVDGIAIPQTILSYGGGGDSGTIGQTSYPLLIGMNCDSNKFNNKMYEVRISNVERSAGYFSTTNNNLKNPTTTGVDTFYLEIPTGDLNISSTPSGAVGASVYIDGSGTASGVTPLVITGFTPGTHTYRLTKTGYTEIPATNFTINSGQTTIVSQAMLTVANIGATGMTVTPSENPCRTGICTVTIVVTWSNSGGTDGTVIPNIKIDTVSQIAHAPRTVLAGNHIDETFIVSGLSVGTHSICPTPN